MKRSLLCLLALGLAARLQAGEVNVYAAASLSDALQDLAADYRASSGDQLVFNFGASSTLAIQIEHGAPADVFFSADEAKMDQLAQAGLLVTSTRHPVLSNTLVIVVNAERGAHVAVPADLAGAGVGRIALAEPATVPAGIYAREYLRKAGLWTQVVGKIVPTENVRACLAAVASGNVDAGIVYKTDALISDRVKIACEIAAADTPKISYPIAVLKDAEHAASARQFVNYVGTATAQAVFVRHGFLRAP